jgi:uncharacterized cupin superfamily protein
MEDTMTTQAHATPTTHIVDTPLDSWPLPAESVIEGNPVAEGAVLSKSDDSRVVRGVWQCTPGRFRWTYTYDETLVVVVGRATVQLENGEAVSLRAGDMAFFDRGQVSTWTIHETLRKGFHADSPDPLPF